MSDARVATVLAYHARSKHARDRYAAGPGTLDWDAQPKAFRDWSGATQLALPRGITVAEITWSGLAAPREPLPFNTQNIGSLLRLCVGLTAWKEYAGSRWSLRAHPSSGNLHPTETWLISAGGADIEDGLYHYQNLDHALERRAWQSDTRSTGVWLGFSSIHWREAWKYGERAFRYCQLDMGHVLAAVSYAAALHGWQPRLLATDSALLAHSLGTDRADDFVGVESEEAEVIVALHGTENAFPMDWKNWAGKPSLLDAKPLYQWPVIEEVAAATRGTPPATSPVSAHPIAAEVCSDDIHAAQVILKRRSAQAFDGQSVMPQAVFKRILAGLLPGGSPVWNMWTCAPRVHPVLLVHRVEGVVPGVYALPRSESAHTLLQTAFRETFAWERMDAELPLYQLIAARAGKTARTLSCHQDIAMQGAITFMMVAEFAAPIAAAPAAYRHLHWEAGMLGHIITLEAEAAGWRGTGIGCFFDDAVHEVLGIKNDMFQVIYHYAVGMALDDPRISTLPAYE
ncbi:MAG: nitroreductase family protein [Gallionella sp.]|nr:nitroreductase family protein [Gallionella sp.]MCK9353296.1 nitroreductase family protein [Gallionella sp.]